MDIEFGRLPEVDTAAIVALMTSASVRRHMPLTSDGFDEERCASFVAAKERLWAEHGYGPWAFLAGGVFLGWGGVQPEGDDADLALVLDRAAWGLGAAICREVLRRAFTEQGHDSVTVLLPPSRGRAAGLRRLGFTPDGEVEIDGHRFPRHRLGRGTWLAEQQP
ncbi:MAG: GNAT family protein [Umezawaea sp.]